MLVSVLVSVRVPVLAPGVFGLVCVPVAVSVDVWGCCLPRTCLLLVAGSCNAASCACVLHRRYVTSIMVQQAAGCTWGDFFKFGLLAQVCVLE